MNPRSSSSGLGPDDSPRINRNIRSSPPTSPPQVRWSEWIERAFRNLSSLVRDSSGQLLTVQDEMQAQHQNAIENYARFLGRAPQTLQASPELLNLAKSLHEMRGLLGWQKETATCLRDQSKDLVTRTMDLSLTLPNIDGTGSVDNTQFVIPPRPDSNAESSRVVPTIVASSANGEFFRAESLSVRLKKCEDEMELLNDDAVRLEREDLSYEAADCREKLKDISLQWDPLYRLTFSRLTDIEEAFRRHSDRRNPISQPRTGPIFDEEELRAAEQEAKRPRLG